MSLGNIFVVFVRIAAILFWLYIILQLLSLNDHFYCRSLKKLGNLREKNVVSNLVI